MTQAAATAASAFISSLGVVIDSGLVSAVIGLLCVSLSCVVGVSAKALLGFGEHRVSRSSLLEASIYTDRQNN